MERFLLDVRFAIRTARRNLGFTTIAVLTLALGIGLNTAVFSVINTVLLRKLPYTAPDRLVSLSQKFPRQSEASLGACPAEYLDYRDRTRVFSGVAGYEDVVFDLTGLSEPLNVPAERVTHNLFLTLGVAPLAGRTFSADEDQPAGPKVIVLSYDFWQRHFGGNAHTVGSIVRLNEQPYTVIGIMPSGFEFPSTASSVGQPPALWVPMGFTAREIQDRLAEFPVHIVARLKADVSLTQAEQDVQRVAAEFQREHPDLYSGNLVLQVNLDPFGAGERARTQPILLTLAAATLLVLLIACANVMNLLLARAAARRREMAVRAALGASRLRLVGQSLVEGMLLTVLGASFGCLLAQAIVKLVASLWPTFVSGLAQARIDLTVLLFMVTASAITSLLCGLAPAFGWGWSNIGDALKRAGRDGSSHDSHHIRSVFVVAEAAGAVVLLVGAGLLIHSLVHVLRVPMGFSPEGVLIARTTFNRQRYPSSDQRHNAERQMIKSIAALPGVAAVGLTTHIPLADDRRIGFMLEGEDVHSARWADNALVSDDYFSAMGIRLLRGRTFGPQDTPQAPLAAIVNESMVRQFWPNGDPIGKRLVWGGRTLTIIGVVVDVHVQALESAVAPTIYNSIYQIESGATRNAVFIIRARSGDPSSLASAVRSVIWSVDHDVPVFDLRTMNQIVSRSLTTRLFAASLLLSFALLALVLAVIGLYGVLSYAIAQRTSELGVRFALGATPGQVVRLVLRDGLRLSVAGIVIGGLVGIGVARAMSHQLFGVGSFDWVSFATAASTLLVVALIASYVPAKRASHIDPMVALRHD